LNGNGEATPLSLIESADRGHAWAVDESVRLIRVFARHVCGHARLPGAPELDWEDVAQEACKAFFGGGLQRFRPGGSETGYLYSLVRLTRLRIARAANRRRQRDDASSSRSRVADTGPEPGVETEMIMRRLDDPCRHVMRRVFLEGVSYAELAVELGLAESSVRSRLTRCLEKARELVT
jgi:RNA polymerase sigma factor (sigma-70 family)